MRRFLSAALAVGATAMSLAACGPTYSYYSYDSPYYRPYYYSSYYYDDCYGSYRPAYCTYPRFSGTVVIAGTPYRGLRYRDGPYGREFWFGGRWVLQT